MKHSKSSLFLMELIIAILFFSLASTVCIQLFAKAHILSKQTVEENHALIQAQNLAELFLAADEDLDLIMETATDGVLQDKQDKTTDRAESSVGRQLACYYDGEWNPTDSAHARYEARIEISAVDTGLISANITVTSASDLENPIYTLEVKHHVPQRSYDAN